MKKAVQAARLKRIQETEAVKLLRRLIATEMVNLNPAYPWCMRLQASIDRWERRGWRLARLERK